MKKLIFILALLLMAAPAWADVVIDANGIDVWEAENWDENESFLAIPLYYDANGEGDIRAFALEISLEPTGAGEAFIDWAWSESDYWVVPGNYPDELLIVGETDEGATIMELGSLYEEGDGPPDTNGTLLAMEIIGTPGAEFCIDIQVNAIRGGIVMEDVTTRDLDASLECFTLEPFIPEVECGNLTEEQLVVWEAWGVSWGEEPANWCNPCWRCGDEDGSDTVTITDVGNIFGYVFDPNNDGLGDWNMGGTETITDVGDIFNLGFTGGPAGVPLVCADDPNCI